MTVERRARVHPRKDPRRRVTRVLMRSSTKDPRKRETTMMTRAWNLQTNTPIIEVTTITTSKENDTKVLSLP